MSNLLLMLPRELWRSFNTISTFCAFFSSSKIIWKEREQIAQSFLLYMEPNITSELLHEALQNPEKSLTHYQFLIGLTDKTNFHHLFYVIQYLYKKCSNGWLFNIRKYFNGVGYVSNHCEHYSLYVIQPPKVTFYYYNHCSSLSEDDCLYHRIGDNIYHKTAINNYKTNLDLVAVQIKSIIVVRYMVLQEHSADCLIPFIKNGFPILPSITKYAKNKEVQSLYKEFFHLLFNNNKVIELQYKLLTTTHPTNTNLDSLNLRFWNYAVKFHSPDDKIKDTIKIISSTNFLRVIT